MLWLWIALGVVAVLVVLVVVGYNRLVRLRNEADTGWANIDVQLQRRGDLIPNLVETVRGYAAHERGVFEEVMHYNTGIQSLPWVLVARPLGFGGKEFFSAEGDVAVPQVAFTPQT